MKYAKELVSLSQLKAKEKKVKKDTKWLFKNLEQYFEMLANNGDYPKATIYGLWDKSKDLWKIMEVYIPDTNGRMLVCKYCKCINMDDLKIWCKTYGFTMIKQERKGIWREGKPNAPDFYTFDIFPKKD